MRTSCGTLYLTSCEFFTLWGYVKHIVKKEPMLQYVLKLLDCISIAIQNRIASLAFIFFEISNLHTTAELYIQYTAEIPEDFFLF